jgi:hypothetical protein
MQTASVKAQERASTASMRPPFAWPMAPLWPAHRTRASAGERAPIAGIHPTSSAISRRIPRPPGVARRVARHMHPPADCAGLRCGAVVDAC